MSFADFADFAYGTYEFCRFCGLNGGVVTMDVKSSVTFYRTLHIMNGPQRTAVSRKEVMTKIETKEISKQFYEIRTSTCFKAE